MHFAPESNVLFPRWSTFLLLPRISPRHTVPVFSSHLVSFQVQYLAQHMNLLDPARIADLATSLTTSDPEALQVCMRVKLFDTIQSTGTRTHAHHTPTHLASIGEHVGIALKNHNDYCSLAIVTP